MDIVTVTTESAATIDVERVEHDRTRLTIDLPKYPILSFSLTSQEREDLISALIEMRETN